ncbi:MAG: DUF3696 domain-containing protein [Bacteroidetes bacterium]|nr:DUF3696 domain-containing protein [Bacteroidota bacterium]
MINYFSGLNDDNTSIIEEITIAETGDMTSFPRDFFDQLQQDMAELFKLQS